MSSEYEVGRGVFLLEKSCDLIILLDSYKGRQSSDDFTPREFQQMLVKMVKALSYCVEDPDVVLERFNVKYDDKE